MSMESVWVAPASVADANKKAEAARDVLVAEFASAREKEKARRELATANYLAKVDGLDKKIDALKAQLGRKCSRWGDGRRDDLQAEISAAEMEWLMAHQLLLGSHLDDEGLPERMMTAAVNSLRKLANMALVSSGDLNLSQEQAAQVGAVLVGDFERQWREAFERAYREVQA